MSIKEPLVFPDLILLNDYGGVFQDYFAAVYGVFHSDFIKNKPSFHGVIVSAQAKPEVDGVHRTFYHITHEGEDEGNRSPDIRRMERISYPKWILDSCPHDELLVWENERGRDKRILIWNENEEYLTVLTRRKEFYLFWTAYLVTQQHQKKKLMREYETFIKAKTAQ